MWTAVQSMVASLFYQWGGETQEDEDLVFAPKSYVTTQETESGSLKPVASILTPKVLC